MYGQEMQKSAMVDCSPENQSMTDRLRLRKEHLEAELGRVNAALAAMEENPGVAETVDAIIKAGMY